MGFVINPYDICVANEVIAGSQCTIEWQVDDNKQVRFSQAAQRHHVSTYRQGDVYIHLQDAKEQADGVCDVGMVTAAAMFALPAEQWQELEVSVPLATEQQVQYHQNLNGFE